jgi:predicted GIY-YIG superfamily endonuclease
MGYFVYILESIDQKATYVGATVDVKRRLRQHNGQISGGAFRTTAKTCGWNCVCYVKNFPSWKCALQFEWRLKQLSRQLHFVPPIQNRMMALEELLSLKQSTTRAIPYDQYPIPLEIIYLQTNNDDNETAATTATETATATTNSSPSLYSSQSISNMALAEAAPTHAKSSQQT